MQNTPHINYYEGILQLRNHDIEVVRFILHEFKRKNDERIRITKKTKVKGGIDLYCTSKKYLQVLGKKLQANFGGELKASPQLFSKDHQSGKAIYRLNVLFRPSQFRKGDVVGLKKKVYLITSCSKKLGLKDLSTGKKYLIKYSENVKKIESKYKTLVSKIKPEIEVLDPETYQSVNIQNKKDVQPGQKVKIVKFNDAIWIL